MARGRGAGGLLAAFVEIAAEELKQEIIDEGYEEAISVMESMVVNEGQEAVLSGQIIPDFEIRKDSVPAGEDWPWVSASPYEDFMSEITEAGNSIMARAYFLAKITDFVGDQADQENQSRGVGGYIDVAEDGLDASFAAAASVRF
jgi:hypothetical protein